MRVTNWKRWQRTKGIVAIVMFVGAIACAGGLEETDPSVPIPSPLGFLILLGLSGALMLNITKDMK